MDQSFYDLSTADLQKAAVSSDTLGRMILQYTQQNQITPGDNTSAITALLAQLIKNNQRSTVRYSAYPFSIPIDATFDKAMIQLLPDNPNRKFLIIQRASFGTGNNNNMRVLFQQTNSNLQYIDNSAFKALIPSALLLPPGVTIFTMEPAPINPISILVDGTLGSAAHGIVIEGV